MMLVLPYDSFIAQLLNKFWKPVNQFDEYK